MFIVANWKAYVEDIGKAKKLFAMSKRLARTTGFELILAPSAPFLGALAQHQRVGAGRARGNKSSIVFSAQDISATTGGAKTGEATAGAYAAAGATYAIIGHSERRALGDTDTVVAEKLAHAFAHGLAPILCVGERERDGEGRYLAFLREELSAALAPLTLKERGKIIVAYEPVWAIGKTAADAVSPGDLAEMVLYIRKVLAEFLPGKNPFRSRVLYGGSVEPENIRALAAEGGVDGFLIGHASVEPDTFAKLVRQLV